MSKIFRFLIAFLISTSFVFATDFSTTGVIDGSQSASLIVSPPLSNGIVFGTGYNTTEYQNFYTQSNLIPYYAPGGGTPTTILAPSGFMDASSLNSSAYYTRPYNVYNLVVKGAGVYVFQVTDPLKSVNWTSSTTKDLMAALYVKQGSGTAFNSANTTQNLVSLNDDITNSASANPYPMFYQNNSATDCVTMSLVYFPWGGISGSTNVQITASGPGRIATSCSALGPSQSSTLNSVILSASALQSSITLQNTALINSFTYDCSLFDKDGICISAGGRNTQVSAGMINNTSALLIASYRLDKNNSRVGGYLDQNLSVSNPGGAINQSNNTPMAGLFGVWQENINEQGLQVKVSASLGQKNTTVQRAVIGDSEPGVGSATMISQGAQAIAKYGFALMEDTLVLPYGGIRYTRNNMGGYTEQASAAVTAPLTYSPVNTNSSAAIIGVEARYKVLPNFVAFASGGIERNMSTNYDQYVATNQSIGYIAPVSMNPDMVRTRPTASLGAYYDVEKNQRLGISGIYRQEMYQAVGTTTVMATYTVGL